MKIIMNKKGMTRSCQDTEQGLLESAGWTRSDSQEQAGEEIIRLKPAVKTKATVRASEEAKLNFDKGDE